MADPTLPAGILDHVAWLLWSAQNGYFTDEDRGTSNWMLSPDGRLHPDDVRDRERFRATASALLAALSEHLAERGVLLGPDGLVKAIEIETYDDLDLAWRVNDAPLFTLIPQDPTEEP